MGVRMKNFMTSCMLLLLAITITSCNQGGSSSGGNNTHSPTPLAEKLKPTLLEPIDSQSIKDSCNRISDDMIASGKIPGDLQKTYVSYSTKTTGATIQNSIRSSIQVKLVGKDYQTNQHISVSTKSQGNVSFDLYSSDCSLDTFPYMLKSWIECKKNQFSNFPPNFSWSLNFDIWEETCKGTYSTKNKFSTSGLYRSQLNVSSVLYTGLTLHDISSYEVKCNSGSTYYVYESYDRFYADSKYNIFPIHEMYCGQPLILSLKKIYLVDKDSSIDSEPSESSLIYTDVEGLQ